MWSCWRFSIVASSIAFSRFKREHSSFSNSRLSFARLSLEHKKDKNSCKCHAVMRNAAQDRVNYARLWRKEHVTVAFLCLLLMYQVSQKIYLSLVEHKIKIT